MRYLWQWRTLRLAGPRARLKPWAPVRHQTSSASSTSIDRLMRTLNMLQPSNSRSRLMWFLTTCQESWLREGFSWNITRSKGGSWSLKTTLFGKCHRNWRRSTITIKMNSIKRPDMRWMNGPDLSIDMQVSLRSMSLCAPFVASIFQTLMSTRSAQKTAPSQAMVPQAVDQANNTSLMSLSTCSSLPTKSRLKINWQQRDTSSEDLLFVATSRTLLERKLPQS
jgi:hypothetical protein